ncbi:hypothetical protein K1719_003743 [Acacia pycnantha]|nr:hypothetical protein K1719_003743 [Acacia pycnantha]
MASLKLLPPPQLLPLLIIISNSFMIIKVQTFDKEPMNCSVTISQCNASLYHITENDNLSSIEDIASRYSVEVSNLKPIRHPNNDKDDYLVTVPCTCLNTSELSGYFYKTTYTVYPNDTEQNISNNVYSGQTWILGNHSFLGISEPLTIYLLCGCSKKSESDEIVVTYTVQKAETLFTIASFLNSTLENMKNSNRILNSNPSFIDVGWVLFIPSDLNGTPMASDNRGKGNKSTKIKIVVGILAGLAALLLLPTALILIVWRKTRKGASKKSVSNRTPSDPFHKKIVKDEKPFESEKPAIFSLEEIEEATDYFDETRKIGVGGYGSVYFGVMGEKEVAIKKMRSNKSKEFYAELKVLCKIHHINIVELLGYASGEDHLYLVYEYVANESLSNHLHDPLLRGYQPLSWNARVQIALDAAKGLEYIHDYTKARYVHRDVKTSNILLDEKYRAKVADFGLVRLVERTNDEDTNIATRLVGTPGYLPPESVKELKTTPKTDVFAFGVVLSELVTGKRALFRDSLEANKMKSLITVVNKIFEDNDPETALENVIDRNLQGCYPLKDVFQMVVLAERCLREDPLERPEMRQVVEALSHLMMSSMEWEASLREKNSVTISTPQAFHLQGDKFVAESQGRLLYLKLGYSHEVELTVPPAVRVFCFKNNVVCCTGIDKQRGHQFAATVRSCKPPEVYKGKGRIPLLVPN